MKQGYYVWKKGKPVLQSRDSGDSQVLTCLAIALIILLGILG